MSRDLLASLLHDHHGTPHPRDLISDSSPEIFVGDLIPQERQARTRTSHTVGAQHMGPLDLTAAGTFVEALHILQGLSCHLPMALLHVRSLLLRDSAKDRVPEVGE